MKKVRNLGLVLGLILMISSVATAQYFYTSYGYAHEWYIPQRIHYTINNNYYGYAIAHVHHFTKHGLTNYNVLLHRNGWFVEVRFNGHGHIYKTIRHRYNYPLAAHVCTHHCGYHGNYYNTYYTKYHPVHHTKTVYVNSYPVQKHQHTNYYKNVYVEKQNTGNKQTQQVNQQQQRANQERVVRVPEQNRNVQQTRTNSTNRVTSEVKTVPASRQTEGSQSGRTNEAYNRGNNNRIRQ